MTKIVTINSREYPVYADVSDADDYFSDVYGSDWESISDEDKPKLLLAATRHIDSVEWRGVLKECNQPLQFPRRVDGGFSDDNLVIYACCEEALAIYKNGNVSENGQADIKSIKVQDTEITFKDGAPVDDTMLASLEVSRYLGKYMNKGVMVLY